MSKRRMASAIAVAGTLALVSTACGTGSDSDGGDSGKSKVGLSLSTLNNPFFVQMKEGALEEAKNHDISLSVQDARDDANTQSDQLQSFTTKGMKAIIANPVDDNALAPSAKAAANADIPVVAVDRTINKAKISTTVASDNVEGGKMAADSLAKQLGEEGEIVVLRGQAGTSASRERGQGFTEGIKKYKNIKVVAKQTAEFNRDKGLDVMQNMLQSHPNVKGVFAENDEMALGAIKALGSKAGKAVKVVGFDGNEDGVKAVKKGTMSATIAQQPAELGKMAVRNAVRILDEEDVDEQIKVPVKVVTKKNVAQFS